MRGRGKGFCIQYGACVHAELMWFWCQHSRELPFDVPRCQVVSDRFQQIGWLSFYPQQLLGVALLHVTRQVVLPAEALGTVLTQKVLASCMYYHVSPDIFACVKLPLTVLTAMFFLFCRARGFASVCLEVL